jgi:prevent-host-death family protein
MTTIPLAEAKATLSAVVDGVSRTHERVTVTKNGRPAVVVVAVEDWEALQETLAILSEPGALEEIRSAQREFDAGEGADLATVKAEFEARLGRAL